MNNTLEGAGSAPANDQSAVSRQQDSTNQSAEPDISLASSGGRAPAYARLGLTDNQLNLRLARCYSLLHATAKQMQSPSPLEDEPYAPVNREPLPKENGLDNATQE